ncbi:AfsA-related hotdog domain-containing protein [Streptosporangium canum]|uniref:AfsA-related hotdog domain-containing protein n=1 Tax=Streptosporangium canum TaxID=324952 RepID=UPI003797C5CD
MQSSNANISLAVDLEHPVYFDHPLDHVPGMLMLGAVLDRVPTGNAGQDQCTANFAFHRFAELDAELLLRLRRESTPDHWAAEITQEESTVCSARVSHGASPSIPAGGTAGRVRGEAAPMSLMRRTREGNVALEMPRFTGTQVVCPLLDPAADHHFALKCPRTRGVVELVEAARQFSVLLWQLEYGRPADVRLLLDAVDLDLPTSLSRETPMELRWDRAPLRGITASIAMEVWAGGTRVGSVGLESRAVSESAYRRLRGARV